VRAPESGSPWPAAGPRSRLCSVTHALVQIWVGQNASQSEKVSAFPYAQKYLKDYKRPPVLPITRYAEGKEASNFLELFGPAEAKANCCCVIS